MAQLRISTPLSGPGSYADHDDVLSAVAADIAADRGLDGWDLDPRWADEESDRRSVIVTIPEHAVRPDDDLLSV